MRHVDPIIAAADAIPTDPHAAAHARVERQLRMLDELAEMGMSIARATERWALALEAGEGAPEEAPAARLRGDPWLAYSRVARAVRQTLMLQTRLLRELPALGHAGQEARTERASARRQRIHGAVERAIRDEHAEAEEIEQLSNDAWERLRDEDLGDELGEGDFDAIVARICADLGVPIPPPCGEGDSPSGERGGGRGAPASADHFPPPDGLRPPPSPEGGGIRRPPLTPAAVPRNSPPPWSGPPSS